MREPTYLGDGVYASLYRVGERETIELTTQPGEHWISLSPEALQNLEKFAEKIGWRAE